MTRDPSIEIRDVRPEDVPAVHEMNQRAQPHVSGVTREWVRQSAESVPYFRVAVRSGRVAGFLIGMTPAVDYESPNFLWFRDRYDSFVYIDRVVVEERSRGRRIGLGLYRDVERFARDVAPRLACEVNVRPRNEISLRFHEKFGFESVGEQDTEGGAKTVSMMTKELARAPEESGGLTRSAGDP